jgi:leader peptidase (prepilin peptidase)/N-methyltransferase
MALGITALGGLILGSFMNVVAHRLPRHESLVTPGSHCTACGHAVRPWDNIPLLSWLLLRGRCRDCGTRIPWRYPAVELATALLGVAVVAVRGTGAETWIALVFVALLVPVTLIDLDHRIIPNRLLAPGAVLAVALVAILDAPALPEHLIAGAAAGGALLIAALAYPGGMGMGDVKLAGVMGLFLGASVAVALLAAFLLGTLAGLAVIARRGVQDGRKTALPFGPFLAAGGVIAVLAGPELLSWYAGQFG